MVVKVKLVIGGYAQGKLDYVLRKYHLRECMVWDGSLPVDRMKQAEKTEQADRMRAADEAECADTLKRPDTVVINHFHDWVKQRILDGGCPEEEIMLFVGKFNDCIVISDEIGNGIVPVDPIEREYRERTGRILIQLAGRAEGVERVICGIGQTIK